MNGFQLTALNAEADRLSVQSSVQATWSPTRRKFAMLPPRVYDVSILRDELIILKSRGSAEVRLKAVGGPYGALICRSSRSGAVVLRPGKKHEFQLDDGEAIVIRTEQAMDPTKGHDMSQGTV